MLRHVAYAADEPELQELFAQLLATASDSQRSAQAHPGFATVINDLTPEEARLLVAVANLRAPFHASSDEVSKLSAAAGQDDIGATSRGLSNLLRLGLLEWEVSNRQPSHEKLQQIVGKRNYFMARTPEEAHRMVLDAVKDLQNLKNSVIAAFLQQGTDTKLRVTGFGRQFLEACMARDKEGEMVKSENPV